MHNLADLLRTQVGRLPEARRLAEEALVSTKSLDPRANEVWKTYTLLTEICEQEAEQTTDPAKGERLRAETREFRRLAREAKRNFAGKRNELRKDAELIFTAVASSTGYPEAREVLSEHQQAMRSGGSGWCALAEVLDRVLAGERDEDALTTDLGADQAMILEAILRGLEDPSSLQDLIPAEGKEAE